MGPNLRVDKLRKCSPIASSFGDNLQEQTLSMGDGACEARGFSLIDVMLRVYLHIIIAQYLSDS